MFTLFFKRCRLGWDAKLGEKLVVIAFHIIPLGLWRVYFTPQEPQIHGDAGGIC